MQTTRDHPPPFFALAVRPRGATNRVLETSAREVDFSQAEARVAATYSQGGRPACRVAVLLRVMSLQPLDGLSDPQAEEQLKDRLSLQKFVPLDAPEAVPDETTIRRFRQRLIDGGLPEQLLAWRNPQLEARGYIAQRTALEEATVVESSRKRPDVHAARTGQAPDADARYTRKYRQRDYGYKASAAWLRAHGVEPQIIKKGARHTKLTEQDRADNQRKSDVRRGIERIFAHWQQWQHYRRGRYLGLARNQLELTLKAVAYNLKRPLRNPSTGKRMKNEIAKRRNPSMNDEIQTTLDTGRRHFFRGRCNRRQPHLENTPLAEVSFKR